MKARGRAFALVAAGALLLAVLGMACSSSDGPPAATAASCSLGGNLASAIAGKPTAELVAASAATKPLLTGPTEDALLRIDEAKPLQDKLGDRAFAEVYYAARAHAPSCPAGSALSASSDRAVGLYPGALRPLDLTGGVASGSCSAEALGADLATLSSSLDQCLGAVNQSLQQQLLFQALSNALGAEHQTQCQILNNVRREVVKIAAEPAPDAAAGGDPSVPLAAVVDCLNAAGIAPDGQGNNGQVPDQTMTLIAQSLSQVEQCQTAYALDTQTLAASMAQTCQTCNLLSSAAAQIHALQQCVVNNLGTQAERGGTLGGVLQGLGLHVLAGSGATFDTCVDPQTDNLDCGGCGVVCAGGAPCVAGVCGGGDDGGLDDGGPITDGALADRVIGDVTPFLGTWSEEGTTMTTCPGGQPAEGTSSGIGTLTAGTVSGTIVATETDDGAPPCRVVFDVSGSTATIEPNQTCSNAFATVAYGTVTLTLTSPTTMTRTGDETETGQVNGVTKTCNVTGTSTLTKL